MTIEISKDRTGADLVAAIQRSPYRELEIEPERYRMPVRDVRLEIMAADEASPTAMGGQNQEGRGQT